MTRDSILKSQIRKGEALFSEGKFEEAERSFLNLLDSNPSNSEILNNMGVLHYTRGNLGEAEEFFLKAIAAEEDHQEALLNLANLYENSKRWYAAAQYLEKYTLKNNQDPDLFNQLGRIYLEMGDVEKGKVALRKSITLNPDQEIVRESLSALEEKDSTPRIESSKNPLNILFVQEAPCIRNYKMATALRSRGHRVSLGYTKARVSQMYKGLSDDVYNENILLQSHRHLWDISKNYDIIHCHNEPDILTVAAIAGDTPVVHDTHDLISLRANGDGNLSYFEGVANRGAAGRVYTTSYQLEEAKRLYGIEGPSLVFYNYASEADLPAKFLSKLSHQDGNVHIVYEGGIGGNTHRDFSALFGELANNGVHVHIYPTFYNQEIAQYFSAHETIHYYNPISPKQIMEQMSQYDFGIIPFNLVRGNKRFLDSTIANKLFEYQAARLPVIASPLQSYVDYFKNNPIGITFENAQDIIENIPKLKEIAVKTDFSKHIFTYEGEIGKLETFYEKIIAQVARPEGERGRQCVQLNSQAVPCHICGNTRTEEIDKIKNLSVIFCQECEGYFVHPLPSDEFLRIWYSEEEKKKRWNNDINLAIKANHEQNRYNYKEYFRFASETLNLDGCGKVLEIGCYSGLFLNKFKELGYECKGIDLNEGFVKYGKEHYGLDLECGTLFDFKFTDKSFDIIIFHQVLEHLSDPKSFLKEVRRILKDDGNIFLSVPNTGSIIFKLEHRFLSDFLKHRFIDIPNHLFYFSKNSLKLLLKQSGFEPSAFTTFGSKESSEKFLKKMSADNESLNKRRNDLSRQNSKIHWNDVEAHVLRVILNTVQNESEFLSKRLDDLPGLIAISKKTHHRETGLVTKKVTDGPESSINPTTPGKGPFVFSEMWGTKPVTINMGVSSKNEKPKICHIGGAHSVHLADIVVELDKLGYEQCVIGYYPAELSITPKHIPVYFFPFRNYTVQEWKTLHLEEKLEEFLRLVLIKEKPDIVQGHSLLYSCVPVYMAKAKFGFPTVMMPWSPATLNTKDPVVMFNCQRCIDTLDYFMHGLPNIFKDFQAHFSNLPDEKYVLFRPLIDLEPYETQRQVTSSPRILSARVMGEYYRQDLLVKALPSVIREFPDTKVSLIIGQNPDQGRPYFEEMIRLARELDVEQYCTFIPRTLSQHEFADLIKSHNIIYAMAIHDGGLASTVVQAAYSGAITILRDTKWVDGILDHKVNALRTPVDEDNVRKTLLYAARNLEKLQRRFIQNNSGLKVHDKRYMFQNLMDCYQRLYTKNKGSNVARLLRLEGASYELQK